MAKYTDRTNAALGVALRRQYLSPLDVSAVFRCLADFEAYVQRNVAYTNKAYAEDENTFLQKINPYSYDGQIVSVLDEAGEIATAYIINKAGELEENENIKDRYSKIGESLIGDDKTIEISNGVIMIAGIDSVPEERTKAYQPTLDTLGNIVWSEVSETTIEGLQAIVSALQTRVGAVETDVAAIKSSYLKSVEYEPETGIFTFTNQTGEKQTVDLAIEKVVTNFEYNEETKSLDLTLADGTKQSVPMSAFIDVYTAAPDALQIQVAVSEGNIISATLVDGGISESKLDTALAAKVNAGKAAADQVGSKADKTVVEEIAADVAKLKTDVANVITEEEVNALIGEATIQGSQVSGAVTNAQSAASADKVVGELTFGGKTYNGSSAQEITADDLGVSILGKSGKLSDATEDETHRLVTDDEKTAWNNKQSKLTFDSIPTKDSTNPVTSGAVYLADKANSDAIASILDGTSKVKKAETADNAVTASSAAKLSTARTISLSGDAMGSASFNGENDSAITVTLSDSGVSAGSYSAITVDKKGRVTAGAQLLEVGADEQATPNETLAVGGIFFRKI